MSRIYRVTYGATWCFVRADDAEAAEIMAALAYLHPKARPATTAELQREGERIIDGDPYPCYAHGAEYCGACG